MVNFIDKNSCFISDNVKIEDGVIIYPFVVIEGNTVIGKNCIIGPGCYIKDSNIGDNCSIYSSHIFDSSIKNNVNVGPYAYLRNGASVSEDAKVGTFVEVKNSSIDVCSKVPHLSYIGDTTIGKSVNVGGGCITANYDGVNKNKTIVGDNVFIGSNSCLVAPVSIGNASVVAASSCITDNVPDNSLGIARSRQVNKVDYYNKKI